MLSCNGRFKQAPVSSRYSTSAPAARLGYGLREDGLQSALACVQIQFHGLFKPALDIVLTSPWISLHEGMR